MPLPSALTTTQKNNLRADIYRSQTYLALNLNAVVATARINQTSFPPSLAQLTFDTGSGMSGILVGQTVLISKTNDVRRAYWRGRVRKPTSGSTLFINQTSANFADDDYIFVINDVALHPKVPYADDSGNVFIDFDIAYRALLPIINGLQSAYVITLDGTPKADLALSPTALAPTSGATISTWAWSAPDATFVVGSSSTQNVTLRWTSAGVRWVRLTVTDNGGRSNFITFPVFVCSADYSDNFIQTGVENINITADESGYNATINAFDGVETVLDHTLAVIFSVETIGTSSTPIVSNINFVGRLRNNTIKTLADANYVNLTDTNITIEGIAVQMARCAVETWSSIDTASPTQWGDIKELTVWRMLCFVASDMSTLSNVASIEFDDTTNNFRAYIIPTQSETLWDAMNAIADSINGRVWQTAQGELNIRRSARFLSSSARNALTTVMDFTTQDMQTFTITLDPARTIGQAINYGGVYNTASQKTDIYQAIAPAIVKADGIGQAESINQILVANSTLADARVELGERVANDLEQRNPIPKLDTLLHDGFHFIQPNTFQWYIFIISTQFNNRGVAYGANDRWLCESVSLDYDNNIGTWAVNAVFALETRGGNYQTVVNIAPNQIDFGLPPYPIDDPYPAYPDENPFAPEENPKPEDTPPVKPEDKQPITNPTQQPNQAQIQGGDVVAVWNSASVWMCRDFTKTRTPNWKQIFSSPQTITDFKFGHGNHAYVITNNGVNSIFWRTSNVFAGNPTWNSTNVTEAYELIRTTDTAGEIYIGFGEGCDTGVNFLSLGSLPSSITLEENDGSGWIPFTFTPFTEPTPNTTSPPSRIRMTWDVACNGSVTVNWARLIINTAAVNIETWDGSSWTLRYTSPKPLGIPQAYTDTWTNSTFISYSKIRVTLYTRPKLTSVTIFDSTGMDVLRSTDHGASFASPVDAGTPPSGLGGIDTQRIGNLVFVGTNAKIRQATDGGAFSDTTGGATTGTYARLIRTYGTSGTKLVFGTNAPISGDTLWKIDGGVTAITPNDGSHNGLVVSNNCLDMWVTSDSQIIGVFNFGGTYKLARSSNGGTSWSFVTTNINSGSRYLRVRQSDTLRKQVYLLNADDCLYSNDGGVTTQIKEAPSALLTGIEVKS